MPAAHLCVADGRLHFRVPLSEPGGEDGVLIGREPGCQVRLAAAGVARRHALVSPDSGGWVAENISRQRELLVAGRAVRRVRLSHGDPLQLGDALVLFHSQPVSECTGGGSVPQEPPPRERRCEPGPQGLRQLTRQLAEARREWEVLAEAVEFCGRYLNFEWAAALVESGDGQWHPVASFDARLSCSKAMPKLPNRLLTAALASQGLVHDRKGRQPFAALALAPSNRGWPRAMLVGCEGAAPLTTEQVETMLLVAEIVATVRSHVLVATENADRARAVEVAARDAAWSIELFQTGPVSEALLDRAKRAGAAGVPVVLLGESGTGKELLAAAIHRHSSRAALPFFRVDCTQNSHALHEALWSHTGVAQPGNQGTLFLDKLHAMCLAAQARLADELPRGLVTIASTELPLDLLVRQGTLIEHLAQALGNFDLALPPLRERREEIAPLARHLLRLISPHRPLVITTSAQPLLEAYDWPGNLRELKDVLTRAVSDLRGNLLRPRDLPPHCRGDKPLPRRPAPASLDDVERQHVQTMLARHRGCISTTARELGISRPRLYRMLDRLGIDRDDNGETDAEE